MIQMQPTENPQLNVEKAMDMMGQGKELGADILVLPEMFICPYDLNSMQVNAIPEYHPFITRLSAKAKELNIFLVAGSFPESCEGKIYNTSLVFNNQGETIAKHRKIHLFDINVTNGQCFQESEIFTAGDSVTTFDTPFGKLGLMICYDIRFPELSRKMSLDGALGIIVPAGFNMTTGVHWELTFRSRALDNQVFMCGTSVARDENSSYTAWGHSISTNPWGDVICQGDENEGIFIAQWDFEYLSNIREQLPLLKHRKEDIYLQN